jgi:phosphoribosylformimino-5-aminoimidazole carboxamide ribotide isomerase
VIVSKLGFRLIPVLDVLNGVVVHAIAGNRRRYQKLTSPLCRSADPVEVAVRLKEKFGFSELYLADLDSILGAKTNFNLYEQMKSGTELKLMVDAGLTDFREVLRRGASFIVMGTEILPSLSLLEEAVRSLGEERVVFSLDTDEGRLRSPSEEIAKLTPARLAEEATGLGVKRLILLDLSRVGTERGVNLRLVNEVRERVEAELLVGGGVCGVEDVKRLKQAGVNGVLLSTALHKGRIKPEDLEDL